MKVRLSLVSLTALVVVSACDRKGFRDEVVYTGASESEGRATSEPEPGANVDDDGANDSPVPRSVAEVLADDDDPAREQDGPASSDADDGEPEPSDDERAAGGDDDAPAQAPGEPAGVAEPEALVDVEVPGDDDTSPDEPAPSGEAEVEAEPAPPFTKKQLLRAAAECAVSNYEHFHAAAQVLAQSAAAHAESPDADARLGLQQAWLQAALAWQRAELFAFGPAARSSEPGGLDLRDQIYSWPNTSRCKVEEQLVSRVFETPAFTTSLVNGRTLAALEFLAFHSGTDNACSDFSVINAEGSWTALGEDELVRRRATYAHQVALDVREHSAELLDAWAPGGGNFVRELVDAGGASTTFDTQQAALNAVSNALFYLDNEVKDLKLAVPLGMVPECPASSCPEALESRYALVSTLYLHENLFGFEQLFAGCGATSDVGFDDWLNEVGAEDLALRMQQALDAAQLLVANMEPPVEDALSSNRGRVEELHAAVKLVTDLLKTEFVTVLNLELPEATETDND